MSVIPIAFFSGGPGPGELGLIFLVILVVFGPKRLPEIARTLGKVMADLRHASHDFKHQILSMDTDPPEPLIEGQVSEQPVEDDAEPVSPDEEVPEEGEIADVEVVVVEDDAPPHDESGGRHDLSG